LVTAKDLDPEDLAKVTLPEFKQLSLGRPRYIAAVPPANVEERNKVLFSAVEGKDLQMYPQYYVPYEPQAQNALQRAKPLDVLLKRDPEPVQRYLNSIGRSAESVKYLPLRAKEKDGAVVLDAVSGMPLGIVLVNPW
jgi:hypothetical protein